MIVAERGSCIFAAHDAISPKSGERVLGSDLQRARRVASQIRAGRVVINGMTDDPQAPWSGFKYSGFGREYGQYGIEAFLETRAILES
jgi:aldehyde dehydrogenase (NAD+)